MDELNNTGNNGGRNYSQGYWLVKPQLGKLTVTNLVNFAEAEGTYGVASKGIIRLGKSALYFGVYIVLCIVLSVIVQNWFVALCLWVLLFPLPFRLISLFVFDEKKVKRDFKVREELKSKTDESMFSYFFGIFDIDSVYPHISYMLDGSFGVFIRCVRKTQVGNVQEKAFQHGEGLGAFYNQCAVLGIKPELIDIQASNSYDERFDDLYNHLNEVSSPIMQKILSSMYHHWEDNSSSSKLTYEYFLLRGTGDPDLFWDNVLSLNSTLLTASYKRIQVLNEEQIGRLVGDLYGIVDFPIRAAMNQAVQKSTPSSLRLLWVGDAQGRKKQVSKSVTEGKLRREEELRQKQVAAKRREAEKAQQKKEGAQAKEVSKKQKVQVDKQKEVQQAPSIDLFTDVVSTEKASGLTTVLDIVEDKVVSSSPQPVDNSAQSVDLFSGVTPSKETVSSEEKKESASSVDLFDIK